MVSLGQKLKNETILNVGNFAKAIPHAKAHKNVIALKIKNATKFQKNYPTTTLQLFSAKKNRAKNTKYSRNETMLKIGHLAKAIAHAKAIAKLVVFSVTPFKIDQNKKSKSFYRLSPESGNRKKVDMQRLWPRFRSQQFFL